MLQQDDCICVDRSAYFCKEKIYVQDEGLGLGLEVQLCINVEMMCNTPLDQHVC